VIIALLRFIYLTLPFCTGIDLKTLNKEEKHKKVQKGRKMKLLASNSQWRVAKASKGRKAYSLASHAPWQVQGEHNSPWRAYLLTRRVKAA